MDSVYLENTLLTFGINMEAFLAILCWVNGFTLGYILWAPLTPFKQGLLDGLGFKWLISIFRKVVKRD